MPKLIRGYDEIEKARSVIVEHLSEPERLNALQLAVLKGMSTALQWVCRDGGSTVDDLLNGRPVAKEQQNAGT